jgi:hypothetical protein
MYVLFFVVARELNEPTRVHKQGTELAQYLALSAANKSCFFVVASSTHILLYAYLRRWRRLLVEGVPNLFKRCGVENVVKNFLGNRREKTTS